MNSSSMLAKRFTNADVISHLHKIIEMPEHKTKLSKELMKGVSYIPLKITSKYKKFTNYKDLLQVGYETLWRAILTFDINKSDNFHYWARRWIKQKVAIAAWREKIYLGTCVLSGLELEADDLNDFEESILKIEEQHIVNAAVLELDELQSTVMLDIYDDGKSLRNIGDDIGLSHESVRKIRDSAIDALRIKIDQKLVINI